jgi:cell filamentation protein
VKNDGRYDVSKLAQGQYEPGSGEQVLRNRLGIASAQEMEDIETRALRRVMVGLVSKFDATHRFTSADVCEIHKLWLGEIYEWAGEFRQVNVSKGEFTFAAAARIPGLVAKFESEVLARYTPCNLTDRAVVARALAVTHVELVLIHPFLDGNGRVARIISILMALQAGLPLLDFSSIAGQKKEEYFAAIQAGLGYNYGPMELLFCEIIERSPVNA